MKRLDGGWDRGRVGEGGREQEEGWREGRREGREGTKEGREEGTNDLWIKVFVIQNSA